MPYEKIVNVSKGSREVIAFAFERHNTPHLVYWHISGDKDLEVPLKPGAVTVMGSLGNEIQIKAGPDGSSMVLPLSNRRYVKAHQLSKDELIAAFQNARVLEPAAAAQEPN